MLTPDTILLVAGLGRCGTSLVMQMLRAGGMSCVGKWPSFEDDISTTLPGNHAAWAEAARGHAIKALDPHRWIVPEGEDYRVIWLDRDVGEQAASQLAFIRGSTAMTRQERRRMAKLLQRDRAAALRALARVTTHDSLALTFEEILRVPAGVAAVINRYIGGGLDEAAMARQVRPRGVACIGGALERQLVAMGSPS